MSNSFVTPVQVAGSSTPFFSELRLQVRATLLNGSKPGTRVPPERQLALKFGVSNMTMSRVMQELQSEGLIRRVPGKGTFICRMPDEAPPAEPVEIVAPSQPVETRTSWRGPWDAISQQSAFSANYTTAHTAIFGYLSRDASQPTHQQHWSYRAVTHLERLMQRTGGRPRVVNFLDYPAEKSSEIMEKLIDEGVNSAVIVEELNREKLRPLIRTCSRIMASDESSFAASLVDFSTSSFLPIDSVTFDGSYGSYMAAKHLISLGHRRLAFLYPQEGHGRDISFIKGRIEGCLEAVAENSGVECALIPISTASHNISPTEDPWPIYGRLAEEMWKGDEPYTGVLAVNDSMARTFMESLRARDTTLSEKLSVIGFDDEMWSSAISLTSIHPPIEQMAENALDMALYRLQQPYRDGYLRLILKPHLVARSSTKIIKEIR